MSPAKRIAFFGRLRELLRDRKDIRVVGDRFVFQSEVFFDTGQALLLPEGRAELDQLATALVDLKAPGFSLEALKAGRKGQHAIRINEQWRICFVWKHGDAHAVEVVDYH